MRPTITIKRNALIAAILGLLLAAIAGTALSLQRQLSEQRWVRHTLAVRTLLLQAFSTLQEAESNERGFLLTGDEAFLASYRAARERVPEDLRTLQSKIADNPEQVQRARKLNEIVDSRLSLLAERTEERLANPRTVKLTQLSAGKSLMDAAQAAVAQMIDAENQLLKTREESARWAASSTQGATVVALLLASLLGWAMMSQNRKQIKDLRAALAQAKEESERREQVEDQLRQSQKMEAVGQLTGGIAHDFNNMLAVMVGCMNLLKRRLGSADAGVHELIGKAIEAVDRAADLTHRLLAFSRQQPLAPQVMDLNKLVGNIAEVIRRTLGEDIRVETILASGLWRSNVDPNQIENAILNLAVNARDAMPTGGKLTIETANASIDDVYARRQIDVEEGQYVLLAVTDTGVGMSAELIKKAFEPFFTTKMPGKGTGLGLSQIYGFVKQSCGHIKIYSEPGQGTTVKIYLPRYVGDQGEAPVARRLADPQKALPTGKAEETIVVVEDDEQMRSVVVAMLQELGYTVIEAGSAEKALELMKASCPVSMLLTDIVMPDMNGRALSLKAQELQPGLKVLFATGFSRNAVIHNGVLDKGVNFLPKPFTLEQLAFKVRVVIDA